MKKQEKNNSDACCELPKIRAMVHLRYTQKTILDTINSCNCDTLAIESKIVHKDKLLANEVLAGA